VSVDGRSIARRVDHGAVGSRARSGVPLAEMCFPNVPGSVPLVRRFVGLVTEAYGVAQVGETAALLVSELAGNAATHAQDAAGGRFEVEVNRRDEFLRVEVRDGSPELPVMEYSDVLAESGRGLYLVAQLADGHGTFRLPGGKSVWFEVMAWEQGLERRWP
jgi:anti-sigma regulatory factor (Ser/Thr protein kinase)